MNKRIITGVLSCSLSLLAYTPQAEAIGSKYVFKEVANQPCLVGKTNRKKITAGDCTDPDALVIYHDGITNTELKVNIPDASLEPNPAFAAWVKNRIGPVPPRLNKVLKDHEYCLDLKTNSINGNISDLVLETCNGNNNQKWRLNETSGYFTIYQELAPTNCIEVEGGQWATKGVGIQVATCNNAFNQKIWIRD